MKVVDADWYWGCDCEWDFVHPNTQELCEKCGCCEEDGPEVTGEDLDNYLRKESYVGCVREGIDTIVDEEVKS